MLRAQPRSLQVPWRLLVPALALLGFGLWMALGDAWYLMWDDLKVTGIFSPQMEREVKLASDLLGWHLFHLRPEAAEEVILTQIPEFAAVDVTCGLIPTSMHNCHHGTCAGAGLADRSGGRVGGKVLGGSRRVCLSRAR